MNKRKRAVGAGQVTVKPWCCKHKPLLYYIAVVVTLEFPAILWQNGWL